VRVDFSRPILNMDGEQIRESGISVDLLRAVVKRVNSEAGLEDASRVAEIIQDVAGEKVITLREIAVTTLLTRQNADKLKLTEKLEMGVLAELIHLSKEPVDMTVKQRSDLLDWIAERQPILVVHRANQILDPEVPDEEETEKVENIRP
jgi:hypothetical protein